MANRQIKGQQKLRVTDESEELIHRTIKNNYQSTFPIVGMGGSAGSFHAFELFFQRMPIDANMAFVIVMHLEPTHNVDIATLLQHSTSMPIVEAEDGMRIEPNSVYIIPPGKDMGMHNGHLLLFNAHTTRGARMAIDHFLQSLAEDQWNNAVSIIFSGMGSDGETGVRMIKEKLGMAMAQDPATAEYSSMPLTSIKTGLVDYIIAPEEMPVKLVQYLSHPVLQHNATEEISLDRSNQTHVQKILMLLRSQTGHDFTLYKKNTITRRIERRIAFHQLPDYVHYVNYLRENPVEVETLFNELLIGVTKFFRDHNAFDVLREHLYTHLLQKPVDEPIRIWIAGCSTGEEAYSIAILLTEYLDTMRLKRLPKAQIFATDLDANAIEHARAGYYFGNIASEVSASRLERFFVKRNNGYVVKKEVREMIVFAQHNLIKDAPFTRLDLLCCRNVMIYLTTDLQRKIIPVFHYSLNPKGLLFLGPAESIGSFSESFDALDSKWKLFEKKDGVANSVKMIDFPFHITQQSNKSKEQPIKIMEKNSLAENFHKVLLNQYSPSSLLVNDKGEILYINGEVDNYLKLHSGDAVMNIHRMAREEIKYALGNAIHQAWKERGTTEVKDFKVTINGTAHLIGFNVAYLNEAPLAGLLLIVFKERAMLKKSRAKSGDIDPAKNGAVEELEKELIYTKQQLHSTIEQMETSMEELKSTNEELQSTNEELQSTNEEALTTKEEMQSLNEELMTINLQYQNKAEELTNLNNDMKNLLDNTEIGTIFLDNQLNILRFTPQVNKLFNVIPTDVGRSITHIVSNFDYPAIENTIIEVIERLSGKELEIKTKKNEWYNLRIMPYRTIDNFISGAVLTFTKITPLKALENKLSTLMTYVQSVVDSLPDAAIILDKNAKVLVVNDAFLRLFQLREYEVKEQFFMEIAHNRWGTNKLDHLLLEHGLREFFFQHEFPGLDLVNLKVEISYVTESPVTENTALIMTFKAVEIGKQKKKE
ncbi:CheR family methyltransferase [Pedobacter duraquae]|uniref:protein-glutamate O-methyltransferase n=1 Tax=Pedobacter duraquae TaxID=425511 RepID=A0A4R6IKR6_9SPHI|nr:CheR family methyltransferase [Pedobacter duraquae]TDO22694.1 two-component system CheB/CheR fusion protein [Pedobacter duraquae]